MEENLIDNAGTYWGGGTAWTECHNYGTITFGGNTIVAFHWKQDVVTSQGITRLKLGNNYVGARYEESGGGFQEPYGLVYMSAGTYAVVVEGRNALGGSMSSEDFMLGTVGFADYTGDAYGTYSSQITVPAVLQRVLCVGSLNRTVLAINVFAMTSGTCSYFENVGDDFTNGVRVLVDGGTVDWSQRWHAHDGVPEGAIEYQIEASYGKCYYPVSIGTSHTVDIERDNGSTDIFVSVVSCPWLLSSENTEPISLYFPEGSTLYVLVEPLDEDSTKNSYIGKKRAVSHGDATDYYSTESGTGILTHSYTFEVVQPGKVDYVANGLGGCIAHIAVDIR